MTQPALSAEVTVRLGAFALEVELSVAAGETVAIVGPNGAGKTTLLRALAGLVPLDAGLITVDGAVLDDGASVFVPPERRPVGIVFQDYLLFPHLSALDNVAFGLRSRGMRRGRARERARDWLARVGLDDHADRRPRELSGGQSQRVSLARALAIEPRMLLLDEPLAALDATTRAVTRRELLARVRDHAGVRIVVTHDPIDAAALADRIIVLEGGRAVQEGRLAEVAAHPRSRYVADLVGVNLLEGRAGGGRVAVSGFELVVAGAPEGDALLVIPPRAVTLSLSRPEGTARNVWQGTIDSVERVGDRTRIDVAGPVGLVAEVTAVAADELGLTPGTAVWVAVKATEIEVVPA
ncbi:MAG TPA: ABC transporter ATP-binding protein [Acidimicrobiales bacterium]|nr:ABC transporter ATP-binding protein [Acidimicrobiales bacterium]